MRVVNFRNKFTIYTLECKNNKYYVGNTAKSVEKIFKEHQRGNGSEWTKKYPPIRVLETKYGDKREENTIFYRVLEKYGINNVRGGPYSNIILTSGQEKDLYSKVVSVNDLCHRCENPAELPVMPETFGIYVVELQDNKWSVNYSSNLRLAVDAMLDCGTTQWTKKYKPLSISLIYPELLICDIDNITLNLMKENVRGGSWSKMDIKTAPKELSGKGACYIQ